MQFIYDAFRIHNTSKAKHKYDIASIQLCSRIDHRIVWLSSDITASSPDTVPAHMRKIGLTLLRYGYNMERRQWYLVVAWRDDNAVSMGMEKAA